MLNAPRENSSKDGTDEKPLVLTGDSAAAWELLLGLQYGRLACIHPLQHDLILDLQSSREIKTPHRRASTPNSLYCAQVLHGDYYK
jgi:hypothetical protein